MPYKVYAVNNIIVFGAYILYICTGGVATTNYIEYLNSVVYIILIIINAHKSFHKFKYLRI